MRRPLQTLLTRDTDQDDCHLAIARSSSLKYDFDIIRLVGAHSWLHIEITGHRLC